MMIQQSNCFVIVERGASMHNVMGERALADGGEMRDGGNFGKGQMVAANYTVSPTINFSQKDTQGIGGTLGNFGMLGSLMSMVSGGLKANEASTTLLMIDNRSGVQLAAAEGSAKNWDFNLASHFWGGSGWGGASGYSNTPEGKILTAAFMDSYSQLVRAVRHYKAQQVAGGLGSGGALGVQGGTTAASAEATASASGKANKKKKN